MPTEKEKMIAGQPYFPADPELRADRLQTRTLLKRLNITEYHDPEKYPVIIAKLFPNAGRGFEVEPPFYCDYGYNIYAAPFVFFNFNCVVLDACPVRIGGNTMFGPGVQIYADTHPNDAIERRKGIEFGKPITIGDDCWIGGGAIILPGVTIGHRCIIGAGAVVTHDVPDDSVAVGNPARNRPITGKR
jgi:maltose O-acetyltransferase